MKVRIKFASEDIHVDETVEGADADDVVGRVQEGVASRMKPLVAIMVRSISRVAFAQEVVRRYNSAAGRSLTLPASSEEFLAQMEREGLVEVLEP